MNQMAPSNFLARLLGPTAIIFAITEFKNAKIFPSRDPAVIYLNGACLFVSGLSIILRHNRWQPDWTATITICGWLAMGLGFSRLVWPTATLEGDDSTLVVVEGVLLLAGIFWTWKGYFRS
ncbi:hypothetical protein BR93DRAFT_189587 [Coniochaeta sp. PMI_546]|nr:hypothetical protein BR93DRAFT_189587 [Coniochaeta sp. PMI_546]